MELYEKRLRSVLDHLKSQEVNIEDHLVLKAFEFATRAHGSQRRLSGEPYIAHPVEVVSILATHSVPDTEMLAAALMHDILEDCPHIHPPEILSYFGETVFMLVHGVTKLKRSSFSSATIARTASLRKFLLESFNDLRVLLIRMADRMHNLRTIQYLPDPEKRRAAAQEALDFYAPFGEMFGFHRLKTELETEAFRILDPASYRYIMQRLETESRYRKPLLEKLVRQLNAELKVKFPLGDYRVKSRIKTPYSIYRKMQTQNLSFDQVQDIFGLRVLVPKLEDCYIALSVVHRLWRYHSYFRDYIGNPKPNGYRSLHTLVKTYEEGQTIEVQIRTFEMDRIAEYGTAAHHLYKMENHLKFMRREFRILHELLPADDIATDPGKFLQVSRQQFLAQNISVYTPRGDEILLPRGSTPLDFAFKIHTEIGLHYAGARVNGREVPPDYPIEDGDYVEILTDPNVEPSPLWLNIAKTPLALKKIGEFLKKQKRADALKQARMVLENEILARGYHDLDLLRPSLLSRYAHSLQLKNPKVLYDHILTGNFSPEKVVTDLLQLHHEETKQMLERAIVPTPTKETAPLPPITLGRIHLTAELYPEDTPVVLARCCYPVYGDAVVLSVSDHPLEVHRQDCPNLTAHPERDVRPAVWLPTPPTNFLFEAAFFIIAPNRRGLLKDVISIISDLKINILSNSVRTLQKDLGYLLFIVEVRTLSELKTIIKTLNEKVSDLYRVERQQTL
ncbi:MAG: RelA/SpoT family protein [bacterium JZ-2024 1]